MTIDSMSMVMKDIRGYRQNDIDKVNCEVVLLQSAFFIDYKDGE